MNDILTEHRERRVIRDLDNDDMKRKLSALPREILDISLLLHEKGLEYCGDTEDYLEMLDIYGRSIEIKAQKIEKSLEDGDMDTYTITVHSLKSTSLAVGAVTIFELAKSLEQAGKDTDMESVAEGTERLLSEYREIKKGLDRYYGR